MATSIGNLSIILAERKRCGKKMDEKTCSSYKKCVKFCTEYRKGFTEHPPCMATCYFRFFSKEEQEKASQR